MVVGERIFAAACDPGADQQEDISRSDATGETYYPYTFDPSITEKLLRFMKELKIDYCSADFMEDHDGNVYFLEANICGAWWWVDRYYDGQICRSIVDYLVSKL